MLIAPAVMHRILFRQHHKRDLVYAASRVALGGHTILAFAVGASVFLVADFIYSLALAIAMSLTVMTRTSLWFFVLPLHIRAKRHRDDDATASST
jgi:VIT1/CCC1 family predicted Fe2+/Mn2+ transporter